MSWIYFLVVFFWALIFLLAVVLTRRSLRGVGEPLAGEAEETQSAGANGHIQGERKTTSGSATTGGAHG